MKISYVFLIGLLLSIVLVGVVDAGNDFGAWSSTSGCWTATNDTYTRIMWNTSGSTQTWTPPLGISSIRYFVVGGGGGGGSRGLGAGANGTNASGITTIAAYTAYTVVIGAGGGSDANGGSSTFSNGSITLTGSGGLTQRMPWNQQGQSGTNVTYLDAATTIFRGTQGQTVYGWDGEGCQTLDVRTGTLGGYGYGGGGGQGGYQDYPTGCMYCGCPAGGTGVKGVVVVTFLSPSPVLTTQPLTYITGTGAVATGNISAGSVNATSRGFCYNINGTPKTTDTCIYDNGTYSSGAFTKNITGLTPGRAYFVRAFAVNSAGTGYGEEVEFRTTQPPITQYTYVNGSYTVVNFTGVGTTQWTPPYGVTNLQVLVVAGGGGGASTGSGGGGGGVVYNTTYSLNATARTPITVVVGDGGVPGIPWAYPGNKGSNSSFGTISAEGGGYGVSHGGYTGGSGGSGGGGSIATAGSPAPGGAGSQGFAGGYGLIDAGWVGGSGGGGGAGGLGKNGTNAAGSGNGGIGITKNITGINISYAGGGGGSEVFAVNVGNASGGGGAAQRDNPGLSGTNGLGGGGGGGAFDETLATSAYYRIGGYGGSGTVIVRYLTPPAIAQYNLTVGTDNVIIFAGSGGTSSWTPPAGITNVSVLVVAGGGSGGGSQGTSIASGGGGAGGFNYTARFPVSGCTTVVVGSGGAGVNGFAYGNNGTNSTFGSISMKGGGFGGTWTIAPTVGGSGGGAGENGQSLDGAAGISGQGFAGGNDNGYDSGTPSAAGGGGGAGGAGNDSVSNIYGGDGGIGKNSSITGSLVWYAGGGGGAGSTTNGTGGLGGGGSGRGVITGQGFDGVPNTGGGGGGSLTNVNEAIQPGGNGSSGIVIIRYSTVPESTFSVNTTSGLSPQGVIFNETSTGSASTAWQWNATNVTGNNTPFTFGTTQNVTYIFGVGNWSISLNASNTFGGNVSTQITYVNISMDHPTSNFTTNVTYGVVPVSVMFNDTSTVNPATAWNWSFGDGTWQNGTTQNVTHVYAVSGNYTVFLLASNFGGSNQSRNGYITAFDYTTSGFSANTTVGIAPLPITFNVTSPNDNATFWNWSFGDGTWQNGTTQNATHVYGSGGMYTVTEIASTPASSNTTTLLNYITLYNQTVSGFTANITNGSISHGNPGETSTVGFTVNIPNDNATMWNWSFGDGNWTNGTTQNATHTYVFPGNFTIIEIASNPATSNMTTIIDYIHIYDHIIPGFTANVTTGSFPLNVGFNVTDPDDSATMWNWSFGDGTWQNGTTQNATHIYLDKGVYTVNEIASNPGDSHNYTLFNYISVYNQTISGFTANVTIGVEPLAVGFNVTKVNDNATMWNWSFGDGLWQNSTTQNVTHVYGNGGIYTVTEIVSATGTTNSTTINNYITVYNQTITGFAANTTSGIAPLAIGFNVTKVNDNASIWNWSFGDGTWQNGTTQNVTHVYGNGGIYTITEIASDGIATNTTTLTDYITIYNQTITGFTANSTFGAIPFSVGFNVTTVNDNASIWNWSFGDGNWTNGTTQNVTHTYMSAGMFTIIEIASNSGATNTTTKVDYLNVYYAPSTTFVATPISGSVPLTVIFNDTSLNGPTSWNWSFGDGTYSDTKNTSHVYTISGSYTVILTTTNAYGSSNYSRTISALSALPIANFTASPNIGVNPLDVTFTDTSIGDVIGWSWNFGDGLSSTLQNPIHTYSALGTYPVYLTIQTSVGDNTSRTQYIYVVSSPAPMVDFIGTPTYGTSPLTVSFTDLTSGGKSGWNWSFGDGNYSNLQNPSHVYVSSGQYSVTLVVVNGTYSNYTSKINYININISSNFVSANYSGTPRSGNYPLTVQFYDTSVCNPTCTNWNWDLDGDGSTDSVLKNPSFTYNYPLVYSPKLIASNGINSGTQIHLKYITVGTIYVPTTIPQPTTTWVPGYRDNQTGLSVSFKSTDTNIDLNNGTYLKYWLQNFTATGEFNLYGFVVSVMAPLMHVFGFWIYLIIWGLYLFAVWIRSQDVTLPLIIGILSMGTFGLLFPKEALPVIIIMFVVCGAIIITKLMKDSL